MTNFRDVAAELRGRVRLRPGLLFRSGRGRSGAAAFLKKLGVRFIVDLRERAEIPAKDLVSTTPLLHLPVVFDSSVKKQVMPLLFRATDKRELVHIYEQAYRSMLIELLPRWKPLLESLGSSLPTLIHCRAGKDRTGLVTALLLTVLGVESSDIRRDYLASNERFPRTVLWRIRLLQLLTFGLLRVDNLRFILYCREDYLDAALRTLETEFGGIDAYLERAGVGEETVVRLRTLLLEPAAP